VYKSEQTLPVSRFSLWALLEINGPNRQAETWDCRGF
jgi:hypothetical protein